MTSLTADPRLRTQRAGSTIEVQPDAVPDQDRPFLEPPTVAEDVLLLLFDPRTGSIAGDGPALFPVLAGAVLVDLVEQERIEIAGPATWTLRRLVRARGVLAPNDPLLRNVWSRIAAQPTDVQSLIVQIGPTLRQPTLDRLVRRDDLRHRPRLLGLIPSARLAIGGTSRRAELLAPVRATLVDAADPDPRTATLAALLSAGGALPGLAADIPWSGDVHIRGKALEQGYWGAGASTEVVRRTTVAQIASQVVLSAQILGDR